MDPSALLDLARQDGIHVRIAGDGTLHAAGPKRKLTAWISRLCAHAAAIHALIRLDDLAEEWRSAFEHRAVILERNARIPRDDAEILARHICWKHFERVASHILTQSPVQVPHLVARYRMHAVRHKGKEVGERMAIDLESYIQKRMIQTVRG